MNVLVMYRYDSETEEFDLIGAATSNASALNAVVKWSRDHHCPEQDWNHWIKDEDAHRWTLGPFHIDEVTIMGDEP